MLSIILEEGNNFVMFDKLKSVVKTSEIEFLCRPEFKDIIPEPTPANKHLPDWFKKLPQYSNGLGSNTVKRCPPFLDALTLGWMIPLAADLMFKINDDGSKIGFDSRVSFNLVERHTMDQITSKKSPNPICPVQPLKFVNYWMIKVPKDYSVLFVSPFNNEETRFTCMPGVVHCDEYNNFIHFPFIFNVRNCEGIIRAGTPLVQAIPIKRDTFIKKSNARSINKKEMEEYKKTEKKQCVHMSYYRNFIWKPKLKSDK